MATQGPAKRVGRGPGPRPHSPIYQLLVELLNFDPDAARVGDWLNVRYGFDELQRLANTEPRAPLAINLGNPQQLGNLEAEARPILRDLQQLVRESIAGRGSPIPVAVKLMTRAGRVVVMGDTRDVVLHVATTILTRTSRPPIGICPEDARFFARYLSQRFCSNRCASRAHARSREARRLAREAPTTTRRGSRKTAVPAAATAGR